MSKRVGIRRVLCGLGSLLCFYLCFGLCGYCPADNTPSAAAPLSYVLTTGDQVEISVLGHDDLKSSVTILPDGTFSYQIVGTVHAAGLTVSQLQQVLTRGLGSQLNDPQVTVIVRQSQAREVSVLGAVKLPGKHALKPGWHVLDVIADCGGLAVERPEWVSTTLVRGGTKLIPINMSALMLNADPTQNIALEPDDILLVQARDLSSVSVQVTGEVEHPGFVTAPIDGSVSTALIAAGGPTAKAALSRATIERGAKTIPIDLRPFLINGKQNNAIKLLPGDTLIVPQNRLQFAVLGEVRTPGLITYPDDQPLTMLKALSEAGATTTEADLKQINIMHPAPAKSAKPTLVTINFEDVLKHGDLSKDIPIQPGDVIYVPSRKHYHSPLEVLSFLSPFSYLASVLR